MAAKRLLLIDGDQFIFKSSAALERETQWDDDNHVLYSNAEQVWSNLEAMLARIFKRFNTDRHFLCFSTHPYFRRELCPEYKAARKGARKPLCYSQVRERAAKEYKALSFPTLEADDVMGIMATKPSDYQRIIVSQDKDMKSIPTSVWDGKDMFHVTPAEADYAHLYQTIVGDTSDGYKGCPGCGPVKAAKILPPLEAWPEKLPWHCVVQAFKDKGLDEDEALKQARLARILRWEDWDATNKKPIMWTPPALSSEQSSGTAQDETAPAT